MVGLKSRLKKRGKLITKLEIKESRNEKKIQYKSEADNSVRHLAKHFNILDYEQLCRAQTFANKEIFH